MAIGSDFEIQNDFDIRYIGAAHGAAGAGYYTVLELHQWLQGLADDAQASGDDFMDITRATPSEKLFDTIIRLLNGYNIDDTAAEHLYGGSILQGTADAVIYDGVNIIANEGCHVEIVQNGAIIANDFWNTVPDGETLEGLNRDTANGIASRFMIKVRTASADIDGRRLICQTREWGKTYGEFKINGTSRGINVAALTYADDLNNATLIATIAAIADISNLSVGYNGIDVTNDGSDEFYYSEWDKGANSINTFYERMKWLTRRGTASTLYGLNGELFRGITHEITVDTPSVTDFSATEAVSWSGGTGQMLAINDVNAPTKMWIQLLTGVAPTDNQTITGGTSGATCLVNVTVTERTLSFPFCGASTGSALIGAYGFGVQAADLSASDIVFDLTNTQRQAPNYVTFSVAGLTVGDYVLVGPSTGSTFDFSQLATNATYNSAGVTSIVVTTAIPDDTPASGYIRVELDSGVYRKVQYTSWTGSTFTIASTDFSGGNVATSGNGVMIGYIDKVAASTTESFTAVYDTDRDLYIRVRNGGGSPIKTFETTGTLGSAGGSVTAIRTSDA